MSDPMMPEEIRAWMNARQWGAHHIEWHAVRKWDLQVPAAQAQMTQLGWQRAEHQEGSPGNGLDFLTMHRAMLQLIVQSFPAHADLLTGWATPPTDPDDSVDPMPENGLTRSFSADMQAAITSLHDHLDSFDSEDDLGRYIETSLRPSAADPAARSDDPSTGIHNYLHSRFSDESSPVNMGDPEVNLGNQRFWKLHGWIDARWSAYRQLKGLSDTDAEYAARLEAEKQHLGGMGHAGHHMVNLEMAVPALLLPSQQARLPRSVTRPFASSKATRFIRQMSGDNPIETLKDLQDRVQLAIELELFTIPPYLTALWSLKSSPKIATIIRTVALQEMLHMGLSCNLLVAIGGKPQLNTPSAVPHYPNFPPGVSLTEPVDLLPLDGSRKVIDQFLQIEKPEFEPIPITEAVISRAAFAESTAVAIPRFPSIGDFYDSILQGLATVNPPFSTTGQLATSFGHGDEMFVIGSIDDARRAIDLIKQQGEGTPSSPGDGNGDELAHYYRFEQIKDEVQYVKQADGTYKKDPNRPLPYPAPSAIYPMAQIPAGGYPDVPAVDAFNHLYTNVLNLLHQAWNEGSQDVLDNAIGAMFELQEPAQELMNTPRDPRYGDGNYGPTFQLVTSTTSAGLAEPISGSSSETSGAASVLYSRVQQILDASVNGESIGAHGPFWRSLSRDQFVVKSVYGKKLIATRADGTYDPDESNLIKALEGRTPFGSDLQPPPAGATLPRMPVGYPAVVQAQIDEIRSWIQSGCPA